MKCRTVWKCQDFSVIQILREINFEQYIKSKTAGVFIFWALDFVNFINCILQIVEKFKHFRAPKVAKNAVLEFLDPSKLISRKI